MKQTFVIDTQNRDLYDLQSVLRSMISLMVPDWKEFIKDWSYDIDSEGIIRCPECEEHIGDIDQYCRWCGHKLSKDIGAIRIDGGDE